MALSKMAYVFGKDLSDAYYIASKKDDLDNVNKYVRFLARQKAKEKKTSWSKALSVGAGAGAGLGGILGLLKGKRGAVFGASIGALTGALGGAVMKKSDDWEIEEAKKIIKGKKSPFLEED